ncbi:MAG: restriction endonuclease [Candidatus Bathycorpusculaceae bacterium]
MCENFSNLFINYINVVRMKSIYGSGERKRCLNGCYEKGTELEKLIVRLFSSKGYEVKHNVKFQGRSGVEHQIDVYAEYKAPLHISRVIIECKAYDTPIDKDSVMKLIQEIQDVGVDKGILITTSHFTPDAESTTKGYPIDLWEYTKLKELLGEIPESFETILAPQATFHTKPLMPLEEVRSRIKETMLGEAVVYYPYYEVDAELLLRVEKGFLRKRTKETILNVKILIDALVGAIANYTNSDGILNVMPLLTSLRLSRDEAEALKVLVKTSSLSVPALASQLSWSEAKARKALQGLATRGLVEMTKFQRTIYYSLIKPKLETLNSLSTRVQLTEGEPKAGKLIKPSLSQADVRESLEILWNLKTLHKG